MSPRMKARIVDAGNGWPDPGDLVPGDDGELYRVLEVGSTIHTAQHRPNWISAVVRRIDWTEAPSDDAVFPAGVVALEGEPLKEAP